MNNKSSLDSRIIGSFYRRYLLELFRNSGYFAVINILLESLLEGFIDYLKEPDLYAVIIGVLVQSYFLTRWEVSKNPRKLLGNLIAPAIYSVIEISLEGWIFLQSLHHLAYWIFSLSIGILQTLRFHYSSTPLASCSIVLESIIRSMMIFVMYMVLESRLEETHADWFYSFFTKISHQYFILATLILGLGIGIAELVAENYLQLLKKTSMQLKTYSEWLLGKKILEEAISDSDVLSLSRKDRTVLFMDIRGFTRWSEQQTPEQVVSVLNHYFATAENILTEHHAIKVKFTGDEVMAVFPLVDKALIAGVKLRDKVNELLVEHDIGAGIGIHKGELMEGIIGVENVKYYDVIGDTVNTAKRIEGEAAKGEVLISKVVLDDLTAVNFNIGNQRDVQVKGKQEMLSLYLVLN